MIPKLVESFRCLHSFHSTERDKKIGNFLVRSAFLTNDQPGTFKCARARYKICPFNRNAEKLSGPERSVKITDRFTCTSANVIYCITYTYCKKLYISETGRRLGKQFREHLRDVEKDDKDASKPVARHINLPNHTKQHMSVFGLSLHLGTTESRKNLEQKFIFQIGTLNLHGINKCGTFNLLLFLVAKECTSDLFLNFSHRYGGAKPFMHNAITVSLYCTVRWTGSQFNSLNTGEICSSPVNGGSVDR